MKHFRTDLIALAQAGKIDILIHGANCQNTMGKGFAKLIKETWPEAYEADLQTTRGDSRKLGKFSYAKVKVGMSGKTMIIINLYTQFHWYGEGLKTDYNAIHEGLRNVKKYFGGKNSRFAMPMIGCGLGGGDWNIVKSIIEVELDGENVAIVTRPKAKALTQKEDDKQHEAA